MSGDDSAPESVDTRDERVFSGPVRAILIGVAVVAGLVAVVAIERYGRADAPSIEVIFSEDDGLPETLHSGRQYVATFTVEWVGPVDQRDGIVSVSASRRGPTSEDAPSDEWPIVCEREFDDVVSVAHMRCPFESPGEGEFAILLEVASLNGELLGTGLYAHIVEP